MRDVLESIVTLKGVLLEVGTQLIEGLQQHRDVFVLFGLAGLTQLLDGRQHHDELLERGDGEGEVLLGEVQ